MALVGYTGATQILLLTNSIHRQKFKYLKYRVATTLGTKICLTDTAIIQLIINEPG